MDVGLGRHAGTLCTLALPVNGHIWSWPRMPLIGTKQGALLVPQDVADAIQGARAEAAKACTAAVAKLVGLLDDPDADIAIKSAALILKYGGVPEVKAIELHLPSESGGDVRVLTSETWEQRVSRLQAVAERARRERLGGMDDGEAEDGTH